MSKVSNMQRIACLTNYIKELHRNSRYGWGKRKKAQPVEPNKGKKVDAEIEEYLLYKKRS